VLLTLEVVKVIQHAGSLAHLGFVPPREVVEVGIVRPASLRAAWLSLACGIP
jgi:hypothetical protein